jgi:hypothetical protein
MSEPRRKSDLSLDNRLRVIIRNLVYNRVEFIYHACFVQLMSCGDIRDSNAR